MKLKIEYRPTKTLVPSATNARTHSPEQVNILVQSIAEFGFLNPILVDETLEIIAGHGRVLAAQQAGIDTVPIVVLSHLSDEQKRAYRLADNRIALSSGWDFDLLSAEVSALQQAGFDMEVMGFDSQEIAAILEGDISGLTDWGGTGKVTGNSIAERYGAAEGSQALMQKFGIPPFSVFDTKQGYWRDRKRYWLSQLGDTSATKENVLSGGGGGSQILNYINNGSSGFDPVLAEMMMRWFIPEGGKMLDPFGGEQVKGFVAGSLKREYHGVEIRKEQVDLCVQICNGLPGVNYYLGDSNNISTIVKEREFDFVFTSPPYYDLEIYSKDDMSALGTYEEFMQQYANIFRQAVDMLADNRFLCVKIGEIRDKLTGEYRNFVGDNITLFKKLGLHYYMEISLLTPIGTAAIRAGRMFPYRKLCKTHQNVLIFFKGDISAIKETYGSFGSDAIEEPLMEEIETEAGYVDTLEMD
jgi:hypothetical protein